LPHDPAPLLPDGQHGRALRSLYFRDRAAAGPDLPPTHLAKERVKPCPTLLLHLGLIWLLRKDRISLIPLTSGMATIPIRPPWKYRLSRRRLSPRPCVPHGGRSLCLACRGWLPPQLFWASSP
jgi:hypothetical protein